MEERSACSFDEGHNTWIFKTFEEMKEFMIDRKGDSFEFLEYIDVEPKTRVTAWRNKNCWTTGLVITGEANLVRRIVSDVDKLYSKDFKGYEVKDFIFEKYGGR